MVCLDPRGERALRWRIAAHSGFSFPCIRVPNILSEPSSGGEPREAAGQPQCRFNEAAFYQTDFRRHRGDIPPASQCFLFQGEKGCGSSCRSGSGVYEVLVPASLSRAVEPKVGIYLLVGRRDGRHDRRSARLSLGFRSISQGRAGFGLQRPWNRKLTLQNLGSITRLPLRSGRLSGRSRFGYTWSVGREAPAAFFIPPFVDMKKARPGSERA